MGRFPKIRVPFWRIVVFWVYIRVSLWKLPDSCLRFADKRAQGSRLSRMLVSNESLARRARAQGLGFKAEGYLMV